ncbi:hypothetical protein SAMN05421504_101748 [Amycolatopsis xylanica]|uniref:N-acetyltransferase domain-containing protein n=1 Tax=Amycolatopsis xylanica TaxID=589385 RepID=A0A1H2U0J8_9PSEU|nr:hypothetical protein [Amycolatopsis xylanica]SDW49706.1 hypothetical protein SAMN05421504_101748 [Amycolatopsis xylanica]
MAISTHTAAERPDLWEHRIRAVDVWPEYQTRGEAVQRWWSLLDEEFADFQFVLHDDETDRVVAQGYAGPLAWDGDEKSLPAGFDAAIERVFCEGGAGATALCALAAEIPRAERGNGLAALIMSGMRSLAARHGFGHVVVPVRPSWKARYPLTPIERYVHWRREDGLFLDPWMRVHERLGGRAGAPVARSFRVTGTVAEWESWTGMAFPDSGYYIFPEGLAPVWIDRAADTGEYWGPNVWMVHEAGA